MSEFSKRVIRNEPGVTEIHVEAREVLQDGPVRVECWWSDEDGAYFAQLHDAEESTRPFTATHLAHGDTREQALAHLAIGEYVTALAIAHPSPAQPNGGGEMMQSDAWSLVVREAAEMLERSHEVAEPVALDYANRLHVLADTLRAAHPPEAAPRGERDSDGVFVDGVPTWVCHCGRRIILGMGCGTCLITSTFTSPIHPAAERGVTEITDAMAIAAMREFSAQKGESHDAMWSQMDAQMQAEVISEWRYILAAARDAE